MVPQNISSKQSWHGVLTWKDLIRHAMSPQSRHMQYAQDFGIEKPAKFGPNTDIAVKDTIQTAHPKIRGRVLMLEMGGAKVVNHPIEHMKQTNQFPNANVSSAIIEGAMAHSFAMADDGQMMGQIATWMTKPLNPKANPEYKLNLF